MLPALPTEPLVSVLVANYNYASFIPDTLNSVLQQSYQNFEVIVCDDGSTDESRAALAYWTAKDSRIKAILQENKGHAHAMFSAFQASNGEIICLLDSDDLFLPTKFSDVLEAFRSAPDAGLAIHQLIATDRSLRPLRLVPPLANLPRGWMAPQMSLNAPCFLWGIPPTSALSVRRAIAKLVLPSGRGLRLFADMMIQTQAPLLAPIVAIDRPLAIYRLHGNNDSFSRGFTAAQTERLAAQDHAIWQSWRSLICDLHARGVLEGAIAPPAEYSPSIFDYACARLNNDPETKRIYGEVMQGYVLRAMPWPYRWFWRLTIFLPKPWFQIALNFVYGKCATKNVVSHIGQVLRWLSLKGGTAARPNRGSSAGTHFSLPMTGSRPSKSCDSPR